jgi:hypothetical protein
MQVYWNARRYYRDYCIFVIARNPLFLNFIIVYYSVIAWNYFYNRDWHLGQVIDLATRQNSEGPLRYYLETANILYIFTNEVLQTWADSLFNH